MMLALDISLLGCDATLLGERFLLFRRTVVPQSSGGVEWSDMNVRELSPISHWVTAVQFCASPSRDATNEKYT